MRGIYKAVLFDLDGTLLDTTDGVLAAVEYMIRKAGLPPLDRSGMLTFIGPPIQDSIRRVYGAEGKRLEELTAVFRNRYKDYELLRAEPYDGIYAALEELKRRGFRLAAATYKRQDYAETILRHFGFNRWLEVIQGADQENKLKKADIIQKCLEEMGITDPRQAVMVGDSCHDAEGAIRAGMDFIGVTYGFGFQTREEVMKYGAAGSADTPEEILLYIIEKKEERL